MSEKNRKPQNTETKPVVEKAEKLPDEQPKEKKGLLTRIYDGYQKTKAKVMSTKTGRIVVRGLKVVGAGAGLYGAYKMGAKSVKPTTVAIESGVQEEEPEPPVEENPEITEESTAEA